jgi:hypothetical protein
MNNIFQFGPIVLKYESVGLPETHHKNKIMSSGDPL